MKNGLRMLVVLTLFGLGSGLLLALTNAVTKGPIEKARNQETIEALRKVLPECDNDVVADAVTVEEGGKAWTFYVARKAGAYAGAAFRSSAAGYGGALELMIGVNRDGAIAGVEILLADKETPGLGSRIKEPGFRDLFKGRGAADTRWCAVTKDGGEIAAITGATISSRAAAKAVKDGMDAYARHVEEIK
jgi:electron transport complex protein RnfG